MNHFLWLDYIPYFHLSILLIYLDWFLKPYLVMLILPFPFVFLLLNRYLLLFHFSLQLIFNIFTSFVISSCTTELPSGIVILLFILGIFLQFITYKLLCIFGSFFFFFNITLIFEIFSQDVYLMRGIILFSILWGYFPLSSGFLCCCWKIIGKSGIE